MQTGQFKGLVKTNSLMPDKEMFVVGCFPHILNTTVKRCCQAAFGSKGNMHNVHIQQMHYKIAWFYHERPNFYQFMYVVLNLLDKKQSATSNVGRDMLGIFA